MVAEPHDRLHDRPVGRVLTHPGHERLVDLDLVAAGASAAGPSRSSPDRSRRSTAGCRVRDSRGEHLVQELGVLDRLAFGELEDERLGRHVGLVELLEQHLLEALHHQVGRGHVDRHLQARVDGAEAAQIGDRGADDRRDQPQTDPGHLGGGDELRRADRAEHAGRATAPDASKPTTRLLATDMRGWYSTVIRPSVDRLAQGAGEMEAAGASPLRTPAATRPSRHRCAWPRTSSCRPAGTAGPGPTRGRGRWRCRC